MATRSLKTLLAWVIITAAGLIVLTIAVVDLVDKLVVDEIAARDRHSAFLRATAAMSRSIQTSGARPSLASIERTAKDILDLRPGLRRLSFFDITRDGGPLLWSSDSGQAPETLPASELAEIAAGRSTSYFDDSTEDRAWMITAPVLSDGQVIGALRGRFSVEKFDRITEQERERARLIAVAMVGLTCLVFFVVIQRQVHQPIHRLLDAMRRAEAGDLTSRTLLAGPADLQEVSQQFNRMLDRVRQAMEDKERLLGEIRDFNTTLTNRVTEAKAALHQTHAMLVEARIQAERNEKLAALGEFSAVMAHELGNPLNAISGHLQLAEVTTDPAQLRHHLTIVKAETDRMVRTIQSLLDSTRIHAKKAPLDVNAILRDVLAVVTPTTEARKITVKSSFSPHLPLVSGDARALRGLVFNLITNAVQAMPRGGELDLITSPVLDGPPAGLIVIHGSPQLNAGGVRMVVRDSGVGIPEPTLPHIFEPFFTTRHNTGGTGLGLTICQRTVSAHGGRLAVQSTLGQGTQFTVDFPPLSSGSRNEDERGNL